MKNFDFDKELIQIKKKEKRDLIIAWFLSFFIFIIGLILMIKINFIFSGVVIMLISIGLYRKFKEASDKRIYYWININKNFKKENGNSN